MKKGILGIIALGMIAAIYHFISASMMADTEKCHEPGHNHF
jgi:hypothetical protein